MLQQLLSGELIGSTKIKISSDLKEFPKELFDLAETLELMDLSDNQISELPDDFNRFKKLKILFLSKNKFKIFPKILADCPSLTMVGFKSNQINEIPENSFPSKLQWLILTDNQIEKLPQSIGECHLLQKFGIAGNKLSFLPDTMKNCKNLELLRISANQIQYIPKWLITLPKLSWLAFSGNPCSIKNNSSTKIDKIKWDEIEIKQQLGEGASGIISEAFYRLPEKKVVAVKIFKGEVTSDGFPEDELLTCISAGNHPNLIKLIGEIDEHPEYKKGIVMELISSDYKNLGNPPSFETCTRDTFISKHNLPVFTVKNILTCIASVAYHLHQRGILHGDLYAHNTMVNSEGNALLGDFGAATFYDRNHEDADLIERLDVRAFGCLIEDLLSQVVIEDTDNELYKDLVSLKETCLNDIISNRIGFQQIIHLLKESTN